jgi:anti-sigma factor ChrR (cupin superfamily)
MRDRIAERVASDRGGHPLAARSRARAPEWRPVASGIRCKGLATDVERKRVSMLVRLAPNTEYALHRQGGVEALLRLEGVLFVDERTLHPGDHLRSGSKRATRASSARPDAPACS